MASQENILTLEPVGEVSYEEQSQPYITSLESYPTVEAIPCENSEESESHDEAAVISGSMTLSPRGLFNVNEPQFVPDGFHENRCSETRGLKVTEENKSRLSNLEFLRKRHREGWATEKGITYTTEMTGCKPTDSELISLSLEGLKFRGRVVTNEGAIHDFDTEIELNENITANDMAHDFNMFMSRNAELQNDKQSFDKLAEKYKVAKSTGRTGYPSIFGKTAAYYIQEPNGHERQVPPAGIYELHEHRDKVNADGIPLVTICDIPEDCCRMNHLMYGLASTGALPSENQDQIMNYFRDRPMYRHSDNVYGHFDICYYCLMRRGTPE